MINAEIISARERANLRLAESELDGFGTHRTEKGQRRALSRGVKKCKVSWEKSSAASASEIPNNNKREASECK